MKYEYVKRTRTASQAGGDKERKVKVVRPHTPEREPAKSSQKTMRRTDDHRRRVDRDDSEDDYVYKKNKEESPRKEAPTKTTTKQRTKVTVSSSSKPVEKRRVPERRHTEPVKHEAEQRNEVDEGRRYVIFARDEILANRPPGIALRQTKLRLCHGAAPLLPETHRGLS